MTDPGVTPSWNTELICLALATALGVIQMAWGAFAARGQQGLKWAAGPRDEPRPITGVPARLQRAFANFLETYPLFAAAILMVLVSGTAGALSEIGAITYIVARVVYVPLYASGVPRWRSFVWFIGLIGLVLVLLEPFI
jgi:uncharacterized MAPEG superfamily protein